MSKQSLSVVDLRNEAADEGIDLDEQTVKLTQAVALHSRLRQREAEKARKPWVYVFATVLTALLGGEGYQVFHAANPELEAARTEVQELKAQNEEKRQARVNGRLTGAEERITSVEGSQAGLNSKVDRLLDASLPPAEAEKAKTEAKQTAAAVEKKAKDKLKADLLRDSGT